MTGSKRKVEYEFDKEMEFKLEEGQEFRFEVEHNEKMVIELTDGLCETFGTELVKGIKYTFFSGSKRAIFTYHGCTINVSFYYLPLSDEQNNCISSFYKSQETPMIFYVNLHGYLEKMRDEAARRRKKGPVVLLAGPTDVGKSTLCKILLNYAVNCDRTPIYVDLDVGQGEIGIPGTIGCNIIEKPCDIETGFSDLAPLCLHFGDKSLDANINLYKILVTELANLISRKQKEDPLTKESGVIINTGGWVVGQGYRLLQHIIREFRVDVILAMDQEKLYNELVRDAPDYVKVMLTPKSGGVVTKTGEHRRENRDQRIKEYFYGLKLKETGAQSYYPHSFDLSFSSFKIYKIGEEEVPNSCLPIGMKKKDHLTELVKIEPSNKILNHILSLTHTSELNEIIRTNIRGFVCVTNVDVEKQTITIISPQPRDRMSANPVFLLSNVQYLDNQ